MKKIFLLISLLLIITAGTFAQEMFLLKNASKKFDVEIKIAKCEDDICEGKAAVYLTMKNQTTPFQTIQLPNMYLELGKDKKPTANLVELYGVNNSGVIFDDYNFDGAEDLALRNGNEGAYGGPSYDVLLYSKAKNNFIKNLELTELASENLGLFEVDKKQKTLETFTKDGCCWHQTARYQIVNNRPKKVYVFTEDAAATASEKVILTTETLVHGRWKKTTKYAKRKEYYKDQ
ncbi:MAG: XAC2610-related protein [Pyrinomonadaceae bacterium]